MNPRFWIRAVGAAALLVGSALLAQEPPPAPAGEQTVALAYKFPTGQVQRFRANLKSSMTMMPEGGGGLGPLPVDVTGHLDYTEKVMGSREGTGTLAVSVDDMALTVNVLGFTVDLKQQNGKLVAIANGQPVPADRLGGGGQLEGLVPSKPFSVKRDANGVLTSAPGAAQPGGSGIAGGQLVSAVTLPTGPVKVGDTWESAQTMRLQLPGLRAAGTSPEVEVNFTHSFKALEQMNGRQIAVIESSGATAPPTDPKASATGNQHVNAVSRFDVARGVLVGVETTYDVSSTAPLPQIGGAGAAGAGAPSGNMKVDGMIEVKLVELPAKAPAAAARPARPAGKKPVRRR